MTEEIELFKKNGVNYIEYNYDFTPLPKNPDYIPPELENDKEWLKLLYKNILILNVNDDDEGLKYWIKELKENNRNRQQVYEYFRHVAFQENQKNRTIELEELFDKTGKKRGLIVLKESLGDAFLITALFKSFHEQYPNHDLYIATSQNFKDVFIGNPYVYKVLPYSEIFENELFFIGVGSNPKIVDIYMHPAIATQRILNYLSINNIAFDLKKGNNN